MMTNVRKMAFLKSAVHSYFITARSRKVDLSIVLCRFPYIPQNYQKLENEEQISLMEKLLDIMEEDDDVQNVWHNWEE